MRFRLLGERERREELSTDDRWFLFQKDGGRWVRAHGWIHGSVPDVLLKEPSEDHQCLCVISTALETNDGIRQRYGRH